MKDKIGKILDSAFAKKLDKFFNSPFYAAVVAVISVVCHCCSLPVTGAALFTLLLVQSLIFCKNSYTLVPFLFMCAFVMSEETMPQTGYYNTPLNITVLVMCLALIVSALVFNLIYYGKWKLIFKRAYLTVSIGIASGLLLFGGIGTETFNIMGLVFALCIGLTMFLPYSLLVNCGEFRGRKTVEYFVWALIAAALAVCADYFFHYAQNGFDYHRAKNFLALGFVGPNTGAAIITMAIPATFYLVYTYRRGFLFLLLIAVEMVFVIISLSKASSIVAIPGTVIVAIALCFKMKHDRVGYYISVGVLFAVIAAVFWVFRDKMFSIIKLITEGNMQDSGRIGIWKRGFEAWKQAPIFGTGLWFLRLNDYWFYSFHCTPLTYLFCGGVVALFGYVYHRVKTVTLVFSAKLTAERVFLALVILAMLANALFDIAMTSPTHLLYYSTVLALIEKDAAAVKAATERAPLPLKGVKG